MSAAPAASASGALHRGEFPLARWSPTPGRTSPSHFEVADGTVLCLFDETGAETRIPMRDCDAGGWHPFVPGESRQGRLSALF